MNCCIICFAIIEKESNFDNEEEKEIFPKFLKLLERYLSVGNNESGEAQKFKLCFDISKDGERTSLASICEECLAVMSSFCELFHQIKYLELLLNWKVKTVFNKMFWAQRLPTRVNCFRESVTDEIFIAVMQYRKILIAKCSKKLADSHPKLILERVKNTENVKTRSIPEVGEIKVDVETEPTEKAITANEVPLDPAEQVEPVSIKCESPDPDLSSEPFLNHFENVEMNSDPPSFPLSEEDEPRRQLRTKYRCKKCLKTFSNNEKLLSHEASNNCEDFNESSDDGSDDNDEVVFTEDFNESSDEDEDLSISSKYNEANELSKTAIIKSEPDELSELCKPNYEEDDSLKCKICSKTYALPRSLRNHQRKQHSNIWNARMKKKRLLWQARKCKQKCPACLGTFASYKSLQEHLRRSRCNPEVKKKLKIAQEDKINHRLKCKLCSEQFDVKIHLKDHLKTVHPEEFRATQSSGIPNPDNKIKHPGNPFLSPKPEGLQTSNIFVVCPECNQLFRSYQEMILHRYNSHVQEAPSKDNTIVELVRLSPGSKLSILNREHKFAVFAKMEVSNDVISCPVDNCRSLFYYEEDLEAHSKLHGQFKCEFCDVTEDYAVNLVNHELLEHSEDWAKAELNECKGWLKCPRCDESHRGRQNLQRHHLSKHLNLSLMDTQGCPVCRDSTKFHRNKAEFMHFNSHHDLSQEPSNLIRCTASNCTAYFHSLTQFSLHFKINHETGGRTAKEIAKTFRRKPQTCKDCGKQYVNPKQLRSHRKKAHPNAEDMIPCSFPGCGRKLTSKLDLKWHMTHVHYSDKDFTKKKCPKCGKIVVELEKHLIGHKKREGLLKRKDFVCEECGKAFRVQSLLKNHLRTHLGPESWEFMCSVCSKKCSTKLCLQNHMMTHSGKKPHICQFCGRAFSLSFSLKRHIRLCHKDKVQAPPRKIDTSNHPRKVKKIVDDDVAS